MFTNGLFTNILGATAEITMWEFLTCIFTAVILGAALTNILMHRSNCSKSFAITIALFPLVVCTIVLLVSDNFGAGLAIAGAFSLIKFRSSAGSAKEMAALFISVAIGIACGTGYIGIAIFFTIIALILFYVYSSIHIWEKQKDDNIFKLCLNYTVDKNNNENEPNITSLTTQETEKMIHEILAAHTSEFHKKETNIKQKKNSFDVETKYSLNLTSAQEELVDALNNANLKIDYTLKKRKKASVDRL